MPKRLLAGLLAVLVLLCTASALAEETAFVEPTLAPDATPYDAEHPEILEDDMLYAPSVILIEASSGDVIYQKNADQVMYPASTTKILTVLLGIQLGDMNQTVTVSETAMQLGSVRLNLFDTAGVREVGADGDAIEAEGIRRSWRKLDEAGLVLAVFDAAQPLSDDDLELARRCQGRPAIAVLNKQDLAGETDVPRGTLEPYFKKIVPMCARDAVGLQALTDAVADLLGTAQLDPEAAQLCSARQLAAATRARDALAEAIAARQNGFGLDAAAVCLTDALQALFDLTGENASDATIEEVFETFCVGK